MQNPAGRHPDGHSVNNMDKGPSLCPSSGTDGHKREGLQDPLVASPASRAEPHSATASVGVGEGASVAVTAHRLHVTAALLPYTTLAEGRNPFSSHSPINQQTGALVAESLLQPFEGIHSVSSSAPTTTSTDGPCTCDAAPAQGVAPSMRQLNVLPATGSATTTTTTTTTTRPPESSQILTLDPPTGDAKILVSPLPTTFGASGSDTERDSNKGGGSGMSSSKAYRSDCEACEAHVAVPAPSPILHDASPSNRPELFISISEEEGGDTSDSESSLDGLELHDDGMEAASSAPDVHRQILQGSGLAAIFEARHADASLPAMRPATQGAQGVAVLPPAEPQPSKQPSETLVKSTTVGLLVEDVSVEGVTAREGKGGQTPEEARSDLVEAPPASSEMAHGSRSPITEGGVTPELPSKHVAPQAAASDYVTDMNMDGAVPMLLPPYTGGIVPAEETAAAFEQPATNGLMLGVGVYGGQQTVKEAAAQNHVPSTSPRSPDYQPEPTPLSTGVAALPLLSFAKLLWPTVPPTDDTGTYVGGLVVQQPQQPQQQQQQLAVTTTPSRVVLQEGAAGVVSCVVSSVCAGPTTRAMVVVKTGFFATSRGLRPSFSSKQCISAAPPGACPRVSVSKNGPAPHASHAAPTKGSGSQALLPLQGPHAGNNNNHRAAQKQAPQPAGPPLTLERMGQRFAEAKQLKDQQLLRVLRRLPGPIKSVQQIFDFVRALKTDDLLSPTDRLLWSLVSLSILFEGNLLSSEARTRLLNLLEEGGTSKQTASMPAYIGPAATATAREEMDLACRTGDFKKAVEVALKAGLHLEAFLLAKQLRDRSTEASIVDDYCEKNMPVGPLSDFYRQLGGVQPTTPAPMPAPKPAPAQAPAGKGVEVDFREGLAKTLRGCAATDLRRELLRYGDYLRKEGKIPEAHAAYLIAGLQLGSNEAWARDYFLIGVHHKEARDVSSFERPEVLSAFQRTDTLVHCLKFRHRDLERTDQQLTGALHAVKLLHVDFLIQRKEYQLAESYLHALHKTLGRYVTLPEARSGRVMMCEPRGASNTVYSEVYYSYAHLWRKLRGLLGRKARKLPPQGWFRNPAPPAERSGRKGGRRGVESQSPDRHKRLNGAHTGAHALQAKMSSSSRVAGNGRREQKGNDNRPALYASPSEGTRTPAPSGHKRVQGPPSKPVSSSSRPDASKSPTALPCEAQPQSPPPPSVEAPPQASALVPGGGAPSLPSPSLTKAGQPPTSETKENFVPSVVVPPQEEDARLQQPGDRIAQHEASGSREADAAPPDEEKRDADITDVASATSSGQQSDGPSLASSPERRQTETARVYAPRKALESIESKVRGVGVWFLHALNRVARRAGYNDPGTVADLGGGLDVFYDKDTSMWVSKSNRDAHTGAHAEQAVPLPPPPTAFGPGHGPPPTAVGQVHDQPVDALAALMAPPPTRRLHGAYAGGSLPNPSPAPKPRPPPAYFTPRAPAPTMG